MNAIYTLDDSTPEAVMRRARALAATLMVAAAEAAAREAAPADIAGILNDAAEAGMIRPDAEAFIKTGAMPEHLRKAAAARGMVDPGPTVSNQEPDPNSVPAGTRRH